MKEYWNSQEVECYICKRSKGGCDFCSIKKDYKIPYCNVFKIVLKKFSLFGKPPACRLSEQKLSLTEKYNEN